MRSLILHGLIFLSFLSTGLSVKAQSAHTLRGKVTDENQKPLAGATVFIDGSKIATATNASGQFELVVPGPGSYHLSAKMLGYAAANNDVMLKEQSANVDFVLTVKSVVLKQTGL